MYAATDVEVPYDRHRPRTASLRQVVEDTINHVLVKGPFPTKRPEVELEGFQLNTDLIRHIANTNGGEVRLAGARADAGKLWTLHADLIIPSGPRVGKGLQFFARSDRHGIILAQSSAISNSR